MFCREGCPRSRGLVCSYTVSLFLTYLSHFPEEPYISTVVSLYHYYYTVDFYSLLFFLLHSSMKYTLSTIQLYCAFVVSSTL
jgi:hypothetical protein